MADLERKMKELLDKRKQKGTIIMTIKTKKMISKIFLCNSYSNNTFQKIRQMSHFKLKYNLKKLKF